MELFVPRRSEANPLNIRVTAGDAEMVVSWADAALRKLCSDNAVLRGSVARFRTAFNQAAQERLMGAHDIPVKLSLQDCDHLLAAVEWALNHKCGGVNESTLDEFISSGLRRPLIEEAARKIESVADMQRRGFPNIASESTIVGLINPPHPHYTGKCPCGCGTEFVKGEQVRP